MNEDIVKEKLKFCEVYHIPSCVGVDPTFPLGTIECYTLGWIKGICSSILSNVCFFITLDQLIKLDSNNGGGYVIGRTPWGPYVKLRCEFYRVRYVLHLSDEEREAYRKSVYEED